MFDVFYIGNKPNLFAHECAVKSIEQAQQQSRTRYFWLINYLTDYTGFDFLWEPVPWQSHQRHAWASQWQKDAGTYLVPRTGYTETNYRTDQKLTRLPDETNWRGMGLIDISWHPDPTEPPMIYQFGTQWQKTGGPRYVVPGAHEVKYVDQPRVDKTQVDSYWSIPAGVDTDSFDFTWHPDDTDPPYIYQFGTQHQRTGGPQYCTPGATDIKYVDQIKIRTSRVATAIYEIDHMDGNAGQIPGTTKTSRYFDNYLDTLRRIAKGVPPEHEFVWVCSSVCDYSQFDFSWHPEQWQATMLHVFASDGEKFGDTFFMHVPTFQARADRCQLLDWYDLNFVGVSVPRRPLPVIEHNYDTHVEAVKTIDWPGPLAVFTTHNTPASVPCVPLWREKTKTVVPMSAGASSVIVPKVAVPYIKKQIYDYPYIEKKQRHLRNDQPLDIVFIDNGEPNAEDNWRWLATIHQHSGQRIERSTGVNGRVAAYHAAAKLSTTPWFFAVFAKLRVDTDFDWSWQPDRLQEPKHYIFHAKNPCNGLIYGHQAMIAYNKQLTLNNPGTGLDFTLDSAHEVVPILSGMAHYNETPWMTWRTAFREVLKLQDSLPDVENEYRINRWCSNSESKNSQWSSAGAHDALEYYDQVNGDFNELKKSYDWAWLASYAFLKHGLIPD